MTSLTAKSFRAACAGVALLPAAAQAGEAGMSPVIQCFMEVAGVKPAGAPETGAAATYLPGEIRQEEVKLKDGSTVTFTTVVTPAASIGISSDNSKLKVEIGGEYHRQDRHSAYAAVAVELNGNREVYRRRTSSSSMTEAVEMLNDARQKCFGAQARLLPYLTVALK